MSPTWTSLQATRRNLPDERFNSRTRVGEALAFASARCRATSCKIFRFHDCVTPHRPHHQKQVRHIPPGFTEMIDQVLCCVNHLSSIIYNSPSISLTLGWKRTMTHAHMTSNRENISKLSLLPQIYPINTCHSSPKQNKTQNMIKA